MLAAVAMVALLASPCAAVDAPAFSMQRVMVTAGVDYARYDEPVKVGLTEQWEIKPSLNLAYNLGKYSSLVASYSRGLKSDRNEYRAGLRIRLYRGLKDGQ
jgi:hypothetical protein